MIAVGYDMRGYILTLQLIYFIIYRISTDDQDLYRVKDARVTCNFDRTKYAFNNYFFGQHYQATVRRAMSDRDHPDDPRVFIILIFILIGKF